MTIERKSIGRLLVTASIVLVVAALGTSVALATHVDPVSGSVSQSGCSIYWTTYFEDSTSIDVEIYEVDPQGNLHYITDDEENGDAPGTAWGKAFVGHVNYEKIAVKVNDAFFYTKYSNDACDTSGPQNWWFSVMGLPGTSPEASYPNAAGNTACALFDVQGWGAKTVDLADYPNCSGEVTVMCLDGEGNWTDSTIHNFAQDGTIVTFLSGQHGTCGFFEQ